jgi:hypothetical protein
MHKNITTEIIKNYPKAIAAKRSKMAEPPAIANSVC